MVPTHRTPMGDHVKWEATANGCTVECVVPAGQNLTAHGFVTDQIVGVELLDEEGGRVAVAARRA